MNEQDIVAFLTYLQQRGIHLAEYDGEKHLVLSSQTLVELARSFLGIAPMGDPNCEQCCGRGCAQCNDAIYYREEEVAEMARRDRNRDLSERLSQ